MSEVAKRKEDAFRPGESVLVEMKFWRERDFPEGMALLIACDGDEDHPSLRTFVQVPMTAIRRMQEPREASESNG